MYSFSAEGINDESFDLLDEETIQKIFNKSGPRLVFKKYFKEYIKKKSIGEKMVGF